MSRRCKGCQQQFRPEFGAQRLCWDCFRRASGETTTTTKEKTMTTEIVEGELLPDVIENTPPPITLFGTANPRAVIVRATEISDELARVIHDKHLFARINSKEHVLVEGWTLLGSMLGLFPYTVWTRKLEDGWEARVEARTTDGRAIAAAESECLRAEHRWANADDYAVRSMAQTRATSKALRLPLGFVMQLAGFDATPADEMPVDQQPPTRSSPAAPVEARPDQLAEIGRLLDRLTELRPGIDWKERAHELAGGPARMLTVTTAQMLIERLTAKLETADQFSNG